MIKTLEKYGTTWHQPSQAVDNALNGINGVDIIKYDIEKDYPIFIAKDIAYLPTLIFLDENNQEVGRLKGAVQSL